MSLPQRPQHACTFYDSAARRGGAHSLSIRNQSQIYFLRNFNNWIKSVLLSEYMEKLHGPDGKNTVNVLDYCCGKGGDQIKWHHGAAKHVTFVDISSVSVDVCKLRYEKLRSKQPHGKLFHADFHVLDCTEDLSSRTPFSRGNYDLVSCQFALHYGFESHNKALAMLKNASTALRDGGYFIATLPNAYEIMRRLRETESDKPSHPETPSDTDIDRVRFGNNVYSITFQSASESNDQPLSARLPLFSARYDFKLEGVVDCPEFLVYPPLLSAMAADVGLTLIHTPTTFPTYFEQSLSSKEFRQRLSVMDALEAWHPPQESSDDSWCRHGPRRDDRNRSRSPGCRSTSSNAPQLTSSQPGAYSHVDRWASQQDLSPRNCVGTLSQPEWEVTSLYSIFIFKKCCNKSAVDTAN